MRFGGVAAAGLIQIQVTDTPEASGQPRPNSEFATQMWGSGELALMPEVLTGITLVSLQKVSSPLRHAPADTPDANIGKSVNNRRSPVASAQSDRLNQAPATPGLR